MISSTTDLREFLIEEMHRLRKKETTYQDAQAIGKLAAQVINSLNIDLEFAKYAQKHSAAVSAASVDKPEPAMLTSE